MFRHRAPNAGSAYRPTVMVSWYNAHPPRNSPRPAHTHTHTTTTTTHQRTPTHTNAHTPTHTNAHHHPTTTQPPPTTTQPPTNHHPTTTQPPPNHHQLFLHQHNVHLSCRLACHRAHCHCDYRLRRPNWCAALPVDRRHDPSLRRLRDVQRRPGVAIPGKQPSPSYWRCRLAPTTKGWYNG